MKTWEQVKLRDIAAFTNGGAWSQSEYTSEGIPVVRVTDIHDETVDLNECKHLPEGALEKYAEHLLETGDLVICTVGSHPTQPLSAVGRPAIIPRIANGALLNQNAVRIAPTVGFVDKQWLGYFGRSDYFRTYIMQHARGAANQVRMSIGLLGEWRCAFRPLSFRRTLQVSFPVTTVLLKT